MGGIADEHVEWAVIYRLKAMLEAPPKTKFNVTQSFALFSTIVLWTKNRAWVAGNAGARANLGMPNDVQAHQVREGLRDGKITEFPWLLSRTPPAVALIREDGEAAFDREFVNTDFDEMNAEDFFKWLRDALAHGDGRSIKPLHRVSPRSRKSLLAGVTIEFEAARGSERKLRLSLYHADMRRLGTLLADLFCRSLSGGDRYFEQEAIEAVIGEAA